MKKPHKWTIFGAGNFIYDIFDCIEANSEDVSRIVLNQKLDSRLMKKISNTAEVVDLDHFYPRENEKYFFGFVNHNKLEILYKLKKYNITFFNLVHPFSYISSMATLGVGNFIGAGVVIAANVEIGNFNFINRSSSIGHDTTIGMFNHFGPGSIISGRCSISDRNFIGSGGIIKDGIRIKSDVTVGAGGVVLKDLDIPGIFAGVPVRKLKE